MKSISRSLVGLLTLIIATPVLAFERPKLPDLPSFDRGNDMNLQDNAQLRVRLAWAEYYLSQLENNDRAMGNVNTTATGRNGRVSWAIGKSVLDSGLFAATVGLAYNAFRQGPKAAATTSAKSLLRVKNEFINSASLIRAAKKAGDAAAVATLTKHREIQLASLFAAVQMPKNAPFVIAHLPVFRAGRFVVITLAAGILVTLATDMGITWFQVMHDAADMEQRKSDLHEIISDTQNRLAGQDEQSARANAAAR